MNSLASKPDDFSESDNNDKKQQEAKYLLAAIIESSQDSIVSIDRNRNITTWNHGAELLYGYPAAEVIGRSLDLVMIPKDILALIENVDRILHNIKVPMYETIRFHKNGKQVDLQVALSPIRNEAGDIVGISTIARDITEAKLQMQLKDKFIAVASHELKTPVTSIKAYSELLLEDAERHTESNSREMIIKLNVQVDRLSDLIKTLLDTAKLSGGEILLRPERFDLSLLINQQIEQVAMLSNKHEIQFIDEVTSELTADRKLIGRAITNLLTNAIKYSPAGGPIIVRAAQENDHTSVSIQDFGVGIPEDSKNKVFDRYFRINNSATSKTSGVGLGLYITSKIVTQHGGTISVESEEGRGSTFSILIPTTR